MIIPLIQLAKNIRGICGNGFGIEIHTEIGMDEHMNISMTLIEI